MNKNMEFKNTLAETLAKLRADRQLTQEEVSDVLGISNKTLSKWELGSSAPDADMLPVLADYYGVSIDELYNRNTRKSKKDIGQCIIDYISSLPADERMNKAFELTRALIRGTLGRDGIFSEPKYPENFFGDSDVHYRSAISNESGTGIIFNGDDLNLFVMMAPNRDNFKTVIREAENYRCLFEFLGKPHAIEVLTVIYRKNFPHKFTPEFVAGKFGIDTETAESLLNEAVNLGLMIKTLASLKDGDIYVYESPDNCEHSERTVLPMIALAYEQLSVSGCCYEYGSHGPSKMIEEV